MDDRKMLELAAKAAGIEWTENDEAGNLYEVRHDLKRLVLWNPLTSDGDALRLAVKLGISIDPSADHVCAITAGHKHVVVERGCGSLLLPATRRAIARAAAELGRGMP